MIFFSFQKMALKGNFLSNMSDIRVRKMHRQFYIKGICNIFLDYLVYHKRFVADKILYRMFIKFRYYVIHVISCDYGFVSEVQLFSILKSIRESFKNSDFILLVRIFPRIFLTKKPAEVRMGRGKGNFVYSVICPVRPGKIIFSLLNSDKMNYFKMYGYVKRISRCFSCSVKLFFEYI